MTLNHVHGADCAQWLPGLEGPCPRCEEIECDQRHSEGRCGCLTCHGTGKAVLLPTLRRECPCINDWSRRCGDCSINSGGNRTGCWTNCQRCHGDSWVADVTLEKLLVAMHEAGFTSRHEWGTGRMGRVFFEFIEMNMPGRHGWYAGEQAKPTAVIAACRALDPETGENNAAS